MREMRAVVRTLKTLADHCHGDERSECPILEDFASAPAKKAARKRARLSAPQRESDQRAGWCEKTVCSPPEVKATTS